MRISSFPARLQRKLNEKFLYQLNREETYRILNAFVAALKEEVEARFGELVGAGHTDPLSNKPLRIAGLGSFKMRTRPQRTFRGGVGNEINTGTVKPPARRLIFSAKWEEIK